MPYVISAVCSTSKDRARVEVCPADFIHEAADRFSMHLAECIAFGACQRECAVEVITFTGGGDDLARADRFFSLDLPGRDAALGSPSGRPHLGLVDATP